MFTRKVQFDYEVAGENYFGKVLRPVAKVAFKSFIGETWSNIWMVVDTGADFSILPRYVAADLGISLEKDCVVDTTMGVGGEQRIYLCKKKMTAKIGTLSREVPLAFFSSDEVPPLLGRLGFLETFEVSFGKSHTVTFKN